MSDRSSIVFKRVLLGLGVCAILSTGQTLWADGPTSRRNTQPTAANRFPPLPDIVARRAAADQKRERAGILTKLAYWTIEFGDTTSYETPLVVSPEFMPPSSLAGRQPPGRRSSPPKHAAKQDSHVIIMPQDEQPHEVAPAVVLPDDDVANMVAPAVHEVADRPPIPNLPDQISAADEPPARTTPTQSPANAAASRSRAGSTRASQVRSSRSSAGSPVRSPQAGVQAGRTHDLETLAAQHEGKTAASQKSRNPVRQAGAKTPPTPASSSIAPSIHDPNVVRTSATGFTPSTSLETTDLPPPPTQEQLEDASRRLEEALRRAAAISNDAPPVHQVEDLPAPIRVESSLPELLPTAEPEDLRRPTADSASLDEAPSAPALDEQAVPAPQLAPPMDLFVPPGDSPATMEPARQALEAEPPAPEETLDPELAAVRRELAELALESRVADSLLEDARRELEALCSGVSPLAIPRADASLSMPADPELAAARDELAALVELNGEHSPAQQSTDYPTPAEPGENAPEGGAAPDLAATIPAESTPETTPQVPQESIAAAAPEPTLQPVLPDPPLVAYDDAVEPVSPAANQAATVLESPETAAESVIESAAKSVTKSVAAPAPVATGPIAGETTPLQASPSSDLVMPELESPSLEEIAPQTHSLPPIEEVQSLSQPEITSSPAEPAPPAVAEDADVQAPAESASMVEPQSLPKIDEPAPLPDLPAEVRPNSVETTGEEEPESAVDPQPQATPPSPPIEETPLPPPAENLAPAPSSAEKAPPAKQENEQVSHPSPTESPQPSSAKAATDLSGPASGLRFARSLLERGDIASMLTSVSKSSQTRSSPPGSRAEEQNDQPSSLPPIAPTQAEATGVPPSEQGVSLPPLPPAKRLPAPGEPAVETKAPGAAPPTNAASPPADASVRPASTPFADAAYNPSIRLARPVVDPPREVVSADAAPQASPAAAVAPVAHWTGRTPELKKPVAFGPPESVQPAVTAVKPGPEECLERLAAATHTDQRIRALIDLSKVDNWHEHPAAADAVLRIAASQADQPSRLLAVRMIGEAPRSTPNALPLLRGLARNDSNGFVRRAAQAVLIEQSSRAQPVAP